MLRQLSTLRKEMYRGYHTLDALRCRAHGNRAKDHQVSPPTTPSVFRLRPAKKRVRFGSSCSSTGHEQQKLTEAISSLEITIADASELVVLLAGCPRLCRQPYTMYLLLEKCMFGRQMEVEQIMDFLLQAEGPGAESPSVLPIIGPRRVGKSTVIEHACNDERVRRSFSKIMCFSDNGMKSGNKKVTTLSDCDVIKHHNRAIEEERVLVIIELTGAIDEDVWRKLYADCKHHVAGGSKIIVASRSDDIAAFGTTQVLRMQFITQEAYWYFFKVRTFGSTDIEDHPKLASIAMDVALELSGCFLGANTFSSLLKENFDARFWSMALERIKDFKRMNYLVDGARFIDRQIVKRAFVRRVNNRTTSEYFVIRDDYQTCSVRMPPQTEIPMMSIKTLLFGPIRPHRRFKVLAWRSHIPPHYSYMLDCELWRPQRMASRKNRIEEITV
ncbi:unnamed protein product [Urochloa decumbens]|uniref:NB-ARC domain-containing protein n=1 Tax=Urochloa decumbens TaxID=240449 RepID=A0ABC9G9E3_9POAL